VAFSLNTKNTGLLLFISAIFILITGTYITGYTIITWKRSPIS